MSSNLIFKIKNKTNWIYKKCNYDLNLKKNKKFKVWKLKFVN